MRILNRDQLRVLRQLVEFFELGKSEIPPAHPLGEFITVLPGESIIEAATACLAEQELIHNGRPGEALEMRAKRKGVPE